MGLVSFQVRGVEIDLTQREDVGENSLAISAFRVVTDVKSSWEALKRSRSFALFVCDDSPRDTAARISFVACCVALA